MYQNNENGPFIAFLLSVLSMVDGRMALSEAREFRHKVSKGMHFGELNLQPDYFSFA